MLGSEQTAGDDHILLAGTRLHQILWCCNVEFAERPFLPFARCGWLVRPGGMFAQSTNKPNEETMNIQKKEPEIQ